jgi:hypothetical protein
MPLHLRASYHRVAISTLLLPTVARAACDYTWMATANALFPGTNPDGPDIFDFELNSDCVDDVSAYCIQLLSADVASTTQICQRASFGAPTDCSEAPPRKHHTSSFIQGTAKHLGPDYELYPKVVVRVRVNADAVEAAQTHVAAGVFMATNLANVTRDACGFDPSKPHRSDRTLSPHAKSVTRIIEEQPTSPEQPAASPQSAASVALRRGVDTVDTTMCNVLPFGHFSPPVDSRDSLNVDFLPKSTRAELPLYGFCLASFGKQPFPALEVQTCTRSLDLMECGHWRPTNHSATYFEAALPADTPFVAGAMSAVINFRTEASKGAADPCVVVAVSGLLADLVHVCRQWT